MEVKVVQLSEISSPEFLDKQYIYKITDQNTTLIYDTTIECWKTIINQVTEADKLSAAPGLQVKVPQDEVEVFDLYYTPVGETIPRKLRQIGSGGSGSIDSIAAEKVTYSNPLTAATNVKQNLDEINDTLDGLADYLATI